jgi:Fe-Mn family superoxide dismutase
MTTLSSAVKNEDGPKTTFVKYTVPSLPYDFAALEPVIDARTMRLHHDHHHASYVANLNEALVSNPELHGRCAIWLLLNPGKVPQELRTVVRHNAGGHVNHSFFWKAMSPATHGATAPAGALAAAIDRDFGSLDEFKQRFVEAGEKLFGSGWVWLVLSRIDGGNLQICTTNGHDNPCTDGHFPILLNDVWEHAYYLNYQNRRGDYLRSWWSIVNWDTAERRFDRSIDQLAERNWEDEGGPVQGVTT